MKLMLINQPHEYFDLLEVNLNDQLCRKNETPDFIHLFVQYKKDFENEMKKMKPLIKKNTEMIIWVSWYKKAALRQAQGKLETNIAEDVIRDYTLQNDLVDVKVCAVSEQWSGLKLIVPLAKR